MRQDANYLASFYFQYTYKVKKKNWNKFYTNCKDTKIFIKKGI